MRGTVATLAALGLLAILPASAGPSGEAVARWSTLALLATALLGVVWSMRKAARTAAPEAASFWDHVAELRLRLLVSAGVFLAAVLTAFSVRVVRDAPYVEPAVYHPIAAQLFARLVTHVVPEGTTLAVLRPTDAFGAHVTLALAVGAAVGLPVLLWQLMAFARPALRPQERRILAVLFAPAVFLFVAGATFAYVWVLPAVFTALYAFAAPLGVEQSFLSVQDLVGFSAMTTLLFGIAFQTPLVMAALARTGIVGPQQYMRYWRHSVLAIVVVAAFATPDGSPVTLAMVAGPLIALYLLGAALSVPLHRKSRATVPRTAR